MTKRLIALLLLVPLLSCTFFTLVPPNSTVTVKDTYAVRTETAWNTHNVSDAVLWTQHGINLDHLMFFPPTEDGKSLLSLGITSGKKLPPFKKTMNLLELPDLMKDSLLGMGFAEVSSEKVQQATLDGNRALRMEFIGRHENGPKMKGFAVMSVKGDRLYATAFFAEETAYYPLVAPSAEKVIASITLAK